MNKSQSKKAVQARRWRDSARETRRLNKIITEYVRFKYEDIYAECENLFQAIKDKYPNLGPKRDLTKTPMFRKIIQRDSSDDEEPKGVCTITLRDVITKDNPTTTEAANESDSSTTAEAIQPFSSTTAEAIQPVSSTTAESIQPVPSTTAEAIQTVQPEIIPVQHLHIYNDSFGETIEELCDEGEYVNMNSLSDNVVADIVNELQDDEELNEILNQYIPIEQEIEVDEGIGLALENEVQDLLNFDMEFDF